MTPHPGRPPGVEHASIPRWVRIVSLPVMVVTGALTSMQAQITGSLRAALGEGMRSAAMAATVSMVGGAVLVLALTLAMPRGRAGAARVARAMRSGRYPWWTFSGGLVGGYFVISQSLSVSVVGVALFAVAVVAGQTTAALAVDRSGLGPGGRQPINAGRAIAAAAALVAVLIASFGGLPAASDRTWVAAVLVLLPFLGGAGNAFQQAVNSRVSAIGGPLPSTLLNVLIGLAVILLFTLVAFAVPGEELGAWPTGWWMYVAGVIGVTFVGLSAALVHVHGVLTLFLCVVAGQVVGAELIHAAGAGGRVSLTNLVAVLLVLAGVGVALVSTRRPRTARPARDRA